jgi:hypothetical protein
LVPLLPRVRVPHEIVITRLTIRCRVSTRIPPRTRIKPRWKKAPGVLLSAATRAPVVDAEGGAVA